MGRYYFTIYLSDSVCLFDKSISLAWRDLDWPPMVNYFARFAWFHPLIGSRELIGQQFPTCFDIIRAEGHASPRLFHFKPNEIDKKTSQPRSNAMQWNRFVSDGIGSSCIVGRSFVVNMQLARLDLYRHTTMSVRPTLRNCPALKFTTLSGYDDVLTQTAAFLHPTCRLAKRTSRITIVKTQQARQYIQYITYAYYVHPRGLRPTVLMSAIHQPDFTLAKDVQQRLGLSCANV